MFESAKALAAVALMIAVLMGIPSAVAGHDVRAMPFESPHDETCYFVSQSQHNVLVTEYWVESNGLGAESGRGVQYGFGGPGIYHPTLTEILNDGHQFSGLQRHEATYQGITYPTDTQLTEPEWSLRCGSPV